jgi:alpha-beta hydrolase superfamily lysophospholipase
MSDFREFTIKVQDAEIACWSVTPSQPGCILQVVHGMMEHSGRYVEFARWMSGKGIGVYINDHPGHGKNLNYIPGERHVGDDIHGHFGDRNGWKKCLDILHSMTLRIHEENPGIPVFILGHSMGSVLVQSYLRRFSRDVSGAILSGPFQQPGLLLNSGIALVDILSLLRGRRHRSRLLKDLGYGSYSKYFKPKRTEFDWLCSDPGVVDEYVNDPYCGFPCTIAFYSDFFRGIRENVSPAGIDPKLPMLIFAGKNDPTGHFGKDPEKIADYYRLNGVKSVDMQIWPDGRHEMLNETNKAEVWEYIRIWIQNHP